MTRSWTQSNKMEKSRDIIYALRKHQTNNNNGQDSHEKNSKRMAELARDYHENFQRDGINSNNAFRNQCTEEALRSLEKRVGTDQRDLLKKIITEEEVEESYMNYGNT